MTGRNAAPCACRAALLALMFVIPLTGCAELNLLNSSFLDDFAPFGVTSLDLVQGTGSVVVVVENLTTEACHDEYASVTVWYVDESGGTRSYPISVLPAVLPANRLETSADYDDSFRKTIVLNCGVRAVWVEAEIHRREITSRQEEGSFVADNDETIQLPRDMNRDDFPSYTAQTFSTGRLVTLADVSEQVTVCQVEHAVGSQEIVPAAAISTTVLTEPTHFQCGDVVLFGILDHLREDGTIVPPTYECTATYFTPEDFLCNGENRQSLDPTTGTLVDVVYPTENIYYDDPSHALLNSFYQYSDTYVILPMVVPDISDISAASLAVLGQARTVGSLIEAGP